MRKKICIKLKYKIFMLMGKKLKEKAKGFIFKKKRDFSLQKNIIVL